MGRIFSPKVSVLMAVKDGEKYLREAMDSILGQTFSDFEFIVVDDGSMDATAQILDRYSDPRIARIKNETSIGLTKSLNLGLKQARGEYIARMDADDISLPGRLEDQVHFLDEHANVAVLGTGIRLVDGQGNLLRDVHFPTEHDLIRWHLCFYNPIAHPSAMMRTTAVEGAGGYDPSLVRSQDYDLWWRLGQLYELANLEKVYVLLRQHTGQVTNEYKGEQYFFGIRILSKYISGVLGRSVSDEVIETLWAGDNLSADKSVIIARFILDYLDSYKKEVKSRACRKLINGDAAFRTSFFILPHLTKPDTWPLLYRAIIINPLKSIKALKAVVYDRL